MGKDQDHSNEMIEVSGELRDDRAASWAIFCGDMKQGANGQQQEKWEFLPKKCCTQGDSPGTWMVPQWLCYEKGLI